MNSKELIRQVEECKYGHWQNSDIGKNAEGMLEIIAEHLEACEECRQLFDAQEYPERTLIEFEDRLVRTTMCDWIIPSNEV